MQPPPIDESWWDAVLAEEGGRQPQDRQSLPNNKQDPREPQVALTQSDVIDWDLILELYKEDKVVTLLVTGYNRGGLLVSGDSMQGFVPVSHLVFLPASADIETQEQTLENYLNQQLVLKIIECDPRRGRVVLSERAALAEPGKRNHLLTQLQPGDCVTGVVTNVTEFGVFVDLGGVEGLIHVSEISWGRVSHPSDVVKVGDQVRVHVIQVDPERSRIALSLKRLCKNPWDSADERYYPGQVIDAVITSIVPFGAFARLEEGLDGLIHISEINALQGGEELAGRLSEGQSVLVRVLHVDASKQRLGLSLQLEN